MQVYVSTYGKYNNGDLTGAWLKIADYSDKEEFMAACQKLHSDEHDPEIMFQDFEGIPHGFNEYMGECHIDDDVFDLPKFSNDELEIIHAYISATGCELFDAIQNASCNFIGKYWNLEEFGMEMAENGCIEIPDNLSNYFDYESYGRDCLMDFSYTEMDFQYWVFHSD